MSKTTTASLRASLTFFAKPGLFLWTCLAVVCLYLLYASLVFGGNQYRYFSLIDDGQSLVNAEALGTCLKTRVCQAAHQVLVEKEFGRFRPGYWIIQSFLFQIADRDPTAIHVFRITGVGTLLVILLCANIFTITRSFWGSILGALVFFSNFSFTENMIRIGPIEPYQLLVIAFFSWLFLNFVSLSKYLKPRWLNLVLASCILSLCLIKETSVMLIPVLGFFWFFYRRVYPKLNWGLLYLPFLAIVLGKIVARPETAQTDYASFYEISLGGVIRNTNAYFSILYTTFKWFLPIIGSVGFLSIFKKVSARHNLKALHYWYLMMVFSLGILLPWQFVLDRYLLTVIFTMAVVVGASIGILLQEVRFFIKTRIGPQILVQSFFLVVSVVICFNIYFVSSSLHLAKSRNYATWYAGYLTYEHELVATIAELPDPVFLNAVKTLDNWEVLYELPIHLQYLHGQKKVPLIPNRQLRAGEFIVSTSSLVPDLKLTTEVASQSGIYKQGRHEIPQIDLIAFRVAFRYRPLQTWIKPPLTQEKITHHWQVRKIEE